MQLVQLALPALLAVLLARLVPLVRLEVLGLPALQALPVRIQTSLALQAGLALPVPQGGLERHLPSPALPVGPALKDLLVGRVLHPA